MPAYTDLWAINNRGKVYTLSVNDNHWKEKKYYGLELKRISTCCRCTWAIGGDHQIYIYVTYSDVPIRVKEEAFENQRWNPYESFSDRLLPSDRPVWSDDDGTRSRNKDEVCLPNSSWQWESPWYLENSIDGQPLGKEGWTYAIDFPRTFSRNKKWNSCVRRRKWLRYRKFTAVESWTLISGVSEDPTAEPFIDIAVGGTDIPGGDVEKYAVWGVTILGRVIFRERVSNLCPEGQSWIHVPTPNDSEINQLSVGPTGLVWAVNWEGGVIARIGVDRHNMMGTEWVNISCDVKLELISVGINSVWGVCRDKNVWFRTGIQGYKSGENAEFAQGANWVEMVGRMTYVAVGMNDQVFGIGYVDRNLYFRTGVTYNEPNGRRWKCMTVPIYAMSISNSDSEISLTSINPHRCTDSRRVSTATDDVFLSSSSSYQSHQIGMGAPSLKHMSHDQLFSKTKIKNRYSRNKMCVKSLNPFEISDDDSSSTKSLPLMEEVENKGPLKNLNSFEDSHESSTSSKSVDEPSELEYSKTKEEAESCEFTKQTQNPLDTCYAQKTEGTDDTKHLLDVPSKSKSLISKFDKIDIQDSSTLSSDLLNSCNSRTSSYSSNVTDTVVDFVNDISDTENSPAVSLEPLKFERQKSENSAETQEQETDSENEVCFDNDPVYYDYDQMDDFTWCWICSRSCSIDPQLLPNWFFSEHSACESCLNKPWRIAIMAKIEERFEKEMKNFYGKYEEAVKQSKWVKTAKCKIWSDSRSHQWTEGSIELERQGSDNGDDLDKGTLICSYQNQHRVFPSLSTYKNTKFTLGDLQAETILRVPCKVITALPEITCIVCTFLPSHSGLTIYTAKRVVKQQPLKLSFRSNMEMEDWLLSLYVACYDLRHIRGGAASNSAYALSAHGEIYVHAPFADMEYAQSCQMFWRYLGGGHLSVVESCCAGVVWGIGHDNTAWVYTSGYGGGVFKGIAGCNANVQPMYDSMKVYIYENQRWNPLTGFSTRSLPTDRYQWSDQSGLFECTKENTKLPSSHWAWCCEWEVDYKVPGGVDNDGWQYAYDFPRVYHGYKSFTDYVRRRRWFRKCKLVTSGPWKEVGTTPLIAVSIQVDHSGNSSDPVAVWAIATNGDALCRLGVSASCPEGVSWEHVPADQPFQSISVGGNNQVWTVARDGSAFLRHGITKCNVIGDVWFHLEPPTAGVPLKQISCGLRNVMAVDDHNTLFVRQEILPHFPEGTSWKLICSNIQQVSVGPLDQVWVIMDGVTVVNKIMNGVLCRRNGITEENPIGDSWDHGMAGVWRHISIRGCMPVKEDPIHISDDVKTSFRPSELKTIRDENNDSPVC